VGALTALVAASMGLAQYDIKKVLAYSTVSQLGFMFMGMGAGAFSAGMFHVFTHAFFKAALFLGSGSVIMACHHEQDMRNMGGLRRHMPWTFWSMLLATVAIAGIFPFSGFFSKDEILWKVFEGWWVEGHRLNLAAWIMGMTGAFMTAFYMARLMIMTFWGDYRGDGFDPYQLRKPVEHHHHHPDPHSHHIDDQADHDAINGHHPREVVRSMWMPVAILAGLAVIAGFWNVPHSLGGHSRFDRWLSPLLFQLHSPEGQEGVPWIEYALMVFSVLWALGAGTLAWTIYGRDPSWSRAKTFVLRFPNLYRWVHNKYFVDEFYEAAFIGPCKRLGDHLFTFDQRVVDGVVNGAAKVTLVLSTGMRWFDTRIVDGLVNLVAWTLQQVSLGFKTLQSGKVQNYAYVMFAGFMVFALWKFLV
jgi:NADH-quinone oxidoreductase subunit L